MTCLGRTKDLGIIVSNKFTPTAQCEAAAAKALRTLFSIRSVTVNRSSDVLLPLYTALVRPHLEYCIQAWVPYLKKDMAILERVQRLATRMMRDVCHLPYHDRLKRLNLFSLERRRLRGDLIEVYKFTRDPVNSPLAILFTFRSVTSLRGHSLTVYKMGSRSASRDNYFSNRVVNPRNKRSTGVVNSSPVDNFKQLLDLACDELLPGSHQS